MRRRIILKKSIEPKVLKSDVKVKKFISEETNIQTGSPDKYSDKIAKLVPAEIIAGFLTGDNLINSFTEQYEYTELVHWVFFTLLLVLTPIYVKRVIKTAGMPLLKKSQIILSTVAYIFWAFAIGGPFEYLQWYNKLLAGLSIISFSLLSPLFVVEKSK